MNPTLKVADIPVLVAEAKRHDVMVVVDNTFTPPFLFYPIRHGADRKTLRNRIVRSRPLCTVGLGTQHEQRG